MNAVAVRLVPRPTPPSLFPASQVMKAYARQAPVFRDRLPTLELPDEDLVEDPDPQCDAPSESQLDRSASLFESMYEMGFVESAWQAARICADALGRHLGARAVIVQAHDPVRGELRTIGVHGTAADQLGAAHSSDDDIVSSAVLCNETPMTLRLDAELSRLAPRLRGSVGASCTLVAVPAMAEGRCLAVVEIVDADEDVGLQLVAAAYVAQRFAEFLSARASDRG